ncbi:MAG: hypothetical protein QM278_01200 [Pseudomonadota bacterium]|nr:hypothetical protein [Pseudomonadota bacterium]
MNLRLNTKIALCLILTALIAGCAGSGDIPPWTYVAANRLEDFKRAALEGRTAAAERHFQRTVEETKKSGDLALLGRVYLNRYAVQTALLESFDDEAFQKIQAAHPDRGNAAFLSFLKGDFHRTDSGLLPPPYAAVHKVLVEGQAKPDINQRARLLRLLGGTPDDLTRLIIAGRLVLSGHEEEDILQEALGTASRQGWKQALLAYLHRLQILYENRREHEKSRIVGEKIKLLQ